MGDQVASYAETGLLTRADGATTVLCSVTGPTEAKARQEVLDRAFLDVVLKPVVGQPGTREKVLEECVRGALDAVVLTTLHPRTTFQIVVQVLHDDGSLLACAINCAMLALLDAGVSLKSTIYAVSGGLLVDEDTNERQLFVNLTQAQEQEATALFCLAFEASSTAPAVMHCGGEFSQDELLRALTELQSHVQAVEHTVRHTLETRLKRQLRRK